MPTVIFTGSPPPACGFSPSTVPGAVPIWRCSFSPRPLPKASRFTCSITATCGAISLMSMMLPGPWRIYNIGNNRSVEVSRVVELLEQEFGRKARIELVPMQPGDVPETCADVDDLMRDVGFHPATPIETGVRQFVAWYRDYHRLTE